MFSRSSAQRFRLGASLLVLLLAAAPAAHAATGKAPPEAPEAPAAPKPPAEPAPRSGNDRRVSVSVDQHGIKISEENSEEDSAADSAIQRAIRVGSLDAFGDSGEITVSADGETVRVINKGMMRVESSSADVVRMGGDVEIAEGEVVKGDVVAIGGSVSIAGRVLGDAVAIGGDLHLAPTAHVNGEAVCVGGHLEKESGADVGGETVQVGFGLPMGKWGKHRAHGDGRGWSPLFKVLQLAVMALVSFLILSFWGDRVRAMADVLPLRPFKLGFAGMLCWILIVPACLLLVISIIGILFLPVFLVLVFFAFLAGLVTVYLYIGERFQSGALRGRPVAAALTGMVIVHLFSLLGAFSGALFPFLSPLPGALKVFGCVLVFLAATVGIGCVLHTRFGKKNVAPPAPTAEIPPSTDPFGGYARSADPFSPPPVPPSGPAV